MAKPNRRGRGEVFSKVKMVRATEARWSEFYRFAAPSAYVGRGLRPTK